ncbi:MAG: single-stranded-DNA-specific exonuclease RecJ [Omnitrophica bacterium RIFCSPLOWO2_12_FULL_44_17]|uniref:Single-stranded-DNA-specific exonuclease RecJ n=1 Tax=Candidatus Danuiimicrobium aquiferis TaxID=1801832 RepID=A0A1G1KSC5_9BACT|nr:MAG: single-stranded-DNA-specific exonuclease RecJ [Omnitrophica bacterium RIFCSPHIGHO2_02_FULL_45_28]OGW95840.1 MAG: single-stranded-DNA-specific exonuclease RecJ [Omnitrophica bacterium RIFCSPLOWO2_12_FULL_44_17]OGX01941.1 MAG: single-stranded-DNA-specific exonuclease RecJ [Omnitrophica bacterium RIFCSPLOWO2_02_FULL_44_11]
MTTIWEVSEIPDQMEIAELPYSPLIQKLLFLRGLKDPAAIQKFLFPSIADLHDPFLLKGMQKVMRRILAAVDKGEKIMIHGDYDADGITGTAIMSQVLKKLRAQFTAFLPNRLQDGYGVSLDAIHEAKKQGVTLFITVDCGVTAHEQIKAANESGMDVIVIDHHQIHGEELPTAYEIINPNRADCEYPYKELSAAGLVFKLAQALLGKGGLEYLDLAALSTVCDVAPLSGENRVIVACGLELLGKRKQLGLRKLSEAANLKRPKFLASDLGYVLGPRINASGRMGAADTALKLLVTDDSAEAEKLAGILDSENKARQQEERLLLRQALQKVEQEINFNRDRVIVLGAEGWHEGVIGIIAQRLVEKFSRPALVISFDGDSGKGSARSIKGFHLMEGLEYCSDCIEQYGGHELAGGFTIKKEKYQALRKKMNEFAHTKSPEIFLKSIRVDCEIELEDLSSQFIHELSLFEPFGAGNPKPVFLTRGVKTKRPPELDRRWGNVETETYRWWVTDGKLTYEAVWRSRSQEFIFPATEQYTLIYSPKVATFNGETRLVLEVRDLKSE